MDSSVSESFGAAIGVATMAPEAPRLSSCTIRAVAQSVLISDPQHRTTYVNPAFEALTGYSAAEMAGRNCNVLQGPASNPETIRQIRLALDANEPFHGELLNYRKDGRPFWNEISISPVFDADGVLTQFVGVQRDITALVEARAQLVLAANVFDQRSEGIIVTDAAHNIVRVNKAFTAINGYSEADVMGRNPRMLASGRHDAAFYREMWDGIEELGSWQGEIWNRRKDGTVYPEWLTITRVSDKQGATTNYIACFTDVSRRKAAEDRIEQLAQFDALTGLPNRTLLRVRAGQALASARRGRQPLGVMFIDLDHFKTVNDSLGHVVGDALLKAMACRLTAVLREQDTVARVGGDEFVLILPGASGAHAGVVADKLLHATRQPFQIEGQELHITPSIGIAVYPVDGDDFPSLASRADAAMYRAKRDGRNTYRVHNEEIQAQASRELVLLNALRQALERGELQLHYQPQACLHNGHLVGAEALVRWHHPELGWISPAEFIPIAESSGLIVPIGEWVLRTAMQQSRAWLDAGMAPVAIAVNLSAAQFRQPALPELVGRILADTGVAAQYLELELTESVASDDPLRAVAVMNELKTLGVRMSIDDFGTGYSSLSYLKRFSVYKLKIDQSFVRGITDDADDQAIVGAVIALARSLGMRTIAEGVETAEQMACLRDQGCDEMQGYWVGRPLAAGAFRAFVEAHTQGWPDGRKPGMCP